MDETHEVSNVGAFRGTAYHRALELIDFAGRPDERDEAMAAQSAKCDDIRRAFIREQRQSIRIRDIADMVFSNLGLRMAEADRRHELYREAQFVMGVPVSALYPEVDSEETVLIQGIIDAYFEENGELILLDYKTDHVSKTRRCRYFEKRYKRQLDDYQQALEQMLQKKVRQKLIYSFALKCWIEI
ncbi:MAG: PD-(D/E)XK nuclease family protein [Coprococcus sp.]